MLDLSKLLFTDVTLWFGRNMFDFNSHLFMWEYSKYWLLDQHVSIQIEILSNKYCIIIIQAKHLLLNAKVIVITNWNYYSMIDFFIVNPHSVSIVHSSINLCTRTFMRCGDNKFHCWFEEGDCCEKSENLSFNEIIKLWFSITFHQLPNNLGHEMQLWFKLIVIGRIFDEWRII